MIRFALVAALVGLAASAADADVTFYNNYASWHTAIGGGDAEIDFHLTQLEPLGEQYASLGAHFDPGCAITGFSADSPDHWIAATTFPEFTMGINFDTPQYGIGANLFSFFKVSLYSNGQLIYASELLNPSGVLFRGLTTTEPFDRAVFIPLQEASGKIDDIFVGNPVPSPSALALVALGGLSRIGRRRGRGSGAA